VSTADAPLPAAPRLDGPAPSVLVVRAPYYAEVVDGLRDGALRILEEAGAGVDVLDVAGALELAAAVAFAAKGARRRYDAYVALGCVVKGQTDHYDHVCREAMAGLTRVALDGPLCLGNGLLTVHTAGQALERSRRDGHNKGAEAAAAALVQLRAARWLGAA
jgi:6,7-dimethyl-8-ribityllumazine synthase